MHTRIVVTDREMVDDVRSRLLEMGIDQCQIDRALAQCRSAELSDIVQWIFDHPMDASMSAEVDSTTGHQTDAAAVVQSDAASLKCDDCGKLFKSTDMVMLHAERTGHENFSESNEAIKARSPEEIQRAAEELRFKLKELRQRREKEEKRREIEMEIRRRAQGQEASAARERLHQQEMKKLSEEKKRDKAETLLARKKILEKIKEDRDRMKRTAANALLDTVPAAAAAASTAKEDGAPPPAVAGQASSTTATVCTLQIRFWDGHVFKKTFDPDACLKQVLDDACAHCGADVELTCTYPRRTFTVDDEQKTLRQLDLMPNASLFASAKPYYSDEENF